MNECRKSIPTLELLQESPIVIQSKNVTINQFQCFLSPSPLNQTGNRQSFRDLAKVRSTIFRMSQYLIVQKIPVRGKLREFRDTLTKRQGIGLTSTIGVRQSSSLSYLCYKKNYFQDFCDMYCAHHSFFCQYIWLEEFCGTKGLAPLRMYSAIPQGSRFQYNTFRCIKFDLESEYSFTLDTRSSTFCMPTKGLTPSLSTLCFQSHRECQFLLDNQLKFST